MHVSVFFIMFTVIFAGGQAAHSSLKKSRQPRGLTNIENMSRTFGSPCCNCFCVFLRKTLDSHSITVLFSIKVCKWAQTPCINKDWLSTDTFLNTPTGSHKFSWELSNQEDFFCVRRIQWHQLEIIIIPWSFLLRLVNTTPEKFESGVFTLNIVNTMLWKKHQMASIHTMPEELWKRINHPWLSWCYRFRKVTFSKCFPKALRACDELVRTVARR